MIKGQTPTEPEGPVRGGEHTTRGAYRPLSAGHSVSIRPLSSGVPVALLMCWYLGPAARSRAPGPGAWHIQRLLEVLATLKKALFMVQPSLDLNAIGVPLCAVATCL